MGVAAIRSPDDATIGDDTATRYAVSDEQSTPFRPFVNALTDDNTQKVKEVERGVQWQKRVDPGSRFVGRVGGGV